MTSELPQAVPQGAEGDAGPEATNLRDAQPIPLERLIDFENVRLVSRNLDSLVQTMRVHGLLMPIVVRPSSTEEGYYDIVCGHRRVEAARLVGWSSIPAVVRQGDDIAAMQWGLVENIEREEMTEDEIGRGLHRLIELSDGTLTQADVARRIGKDPSYVSTVLHLADEPVEMQNLIAEGRLTFSHYRQLTRIPDDGKRLALAKRAAKADVRVREMEQWVTSELQQQDDPVVAEWEQREFAIAPTPIAAPEYAGFDDRILRRFILYAAMRSFNDVEWMLGRIPGAEPYNHCWEHIEDLSDVEVEEAVVDLARRYVTLPIAKFSLEPALVRALDRYRVRNEDDVPLAAIDDQSSAERFADEDEGYADDQDDDLPDEDAPDEAA